MPSFDLDALLEQLVSSVAKREQDMAGYDAADRVITEYIDAGEADVVTVKLAQTMAIIRASEKSCLETVRELARFVDERKGG
jgi:hypothetical protein